LANDVNDETPWQKIDWWKATFPVELPLYCVVLASAAGAVMHSPTPTVLVLK